MRTTKPPLDRIMQHVVKHKGSGHWEWVGRCRTGSNGEYGGTRLNGKMMSSHRAVWILLKGYIPRDLLHQCGMTLCCNPAHINEGDQRQNLLEAIVSRGDGWGCTKKGYKRPKTKTSEQDRETIRMRAASGENRYSIAASYGISKARVSQIVCGK